ncbi:MAG: efflux RND transporter periplasmic adaptor subunit [Bacteroides sp.]|nr:efflux RND transporter periplasmic adaptor subunit [Bacteroides sp.]MCM1414173.1 efflux RND transporter periplasmic adaptor subunit [Bacteroides sp.]MCM1471277.1 efflux RND transporter periplasmic adaptor subunit [Bacteroides sp.]
MLFKNYVRHVSAIAIGIGLLALSSCSKDADKSSAGPGASKTEETPKVEIRQVFDQVVPQIAEYTATVEAFKTNNISTSTPNRIKSILVDVGSKVAKGQRVVVLDDVNIDQLKVRIDNAEREYNRALRLLEIGGGTQQSVDQIKTELDAQRRQYANMVENTILVSPVSGVVTARNYDPGDMTGTLPILTIEQVNPVKVMVNVSESEFPLVKEGMSVQIKLDVYPDESFTGKVYLIHPTIDSSTRTFTVEITIDNPGQKIVPGMFARVIMNFGEANHVVVPDRAVVKQSGSGNKYVYIYNPQTKTVSYNHVQLGQRIDDAYEILSGVPADAWVVITGQTRLADGVKVEAIDKKSND